MSTLTYIRNFIKDKYVASITPTSRVGVERVCDKIDFHTGRLFVEYGPGTGVISEGILERMRPDARLLLIERNPDFIGVLKEVLDDSRVTVLHEDAMNVHEVVQAHGVGPVDAVVSGIPFSWLSTSVRDHIVRATHEVLRPKGKFIAYQTFWQSDEHLLTYLSRYFDDVSTQIELLNAPPIRIYEARKKPVLHTNGNGSV